MDGGEAAATSSTESMNNSVDAAETAVAAADGDGARAAQTGRGPAAPRTGLIRHTTLLADAAEAGAPGWGGTASGAVLLQVRDLC